MHSFSLASHSIPLLNAKKWPKLPEYSTSKSKSKQETTQRALTSDAKSILLIAAIIYSAFLVYDFQYANLPTPLAADKVGRTANEVGDVGFSEIEAIKHIKALSELGPHPVGSATLDDALEYVLEQAEIIQKNTPSDVDVEVDYFQVNPGFNSGQLGGKYVGKTLVYADLKHVALRITPRSNSSNQEIADNAILVSAHVDTVFSTEGAGDDSSNVAVMLELARGISQSAHGFKNSVIFLFNTGEEDGLNGAHSFITQHPWSSTLRLAIDLESMGIGGKSGIFQAPTSFPIKAFASAAKYPTGNIIGQDLFSAGVIQSTTDFQIYKEIGGLSGLDFAFTDNGAVYHTKNDKLDLLKAGSIQHLGDNMLPFLLGVGSSPAILSKGKVMGEESDDATVYFDILGIYMVVYTQSFATVLYNSVILLSLLILGASLVMGDYYLDAISLGLAFLSTILTWLFSISFSITVAFILPQLSSSPVPFVANQWLVLGLFAAPALLGALIGQDLGYLVLKKYLSYVYSKQKQFSSIVQDDQIGFQAERWLYKAGFVQWLVLLILGNYYKLGSSYLALIWLVPPALAYGLLEVSLTPAESPEPLKLATLLIGLAVPIVTSAGGLIRLPVTLLGNLVRFDSTPGSNPEWLGSLIIAVLVAIIISLTFAYILPYVHLPGAKTSIILATSIVFGLSLILVSFEIIPPFTEDIAKAVNVVHIVDTAGSYGENQAPSSYVSLFSITPGKLTKVTEQIDEGFICGTDKVVDLVTFSVQYGCWTPDTEGGWNESDIPTLHVDNDISQGQRITRVIIDTKTSVRWALKINTNEIEEFHLSYFSLRGNSDVSVPLGHTKSVESVDGWHTIRFAGGQMSPTKFELTLHWVKEAMRSTKMVDENTEDHRPLLKLRTDLDGLTPKAERVLSKLPKWCALYGKSASPHTFSFLSSLPVDF